MRLESRLSLQQEVGWDRDTIRMARYLAESQSSPFVISTPRNIRSQLEEWKDNFPGANPTFDIGSCSLSSTLANLLSLPVSSHFSSRSQLSQLLACSADPQLSEQQLVSSSTFANSTKLGSHIKAAKEAGVTRLFADSTQELIKIKKNFPDSSIILELNVNNQDTTSSLDAESGASLDDISELLDKAAKLELPVVGFAVSAAKLDVLDPEKQLTLVTSKINQAVKALDQIVNHQDSDSSMVSIIHISEICPFWLFNRHPDYLPRIRSVLDSSGLLKTPGLEVTIDATDFLLSSSVTLAVEIIDVKSCLDVGVYQVSEGVYGTFESNLVSKEETDVSAPLPLGGRRNRKGLSAKLLETNILGPSGDDLDVVVEDIVLQRMEVGDWLLFPNVGAKNISEFSEGKLIKGSQACIYIKEKAKNSYSGAAPMPGDMFEAAAGAEVKTVSLDESAEGGDTSVMQGLLGEDVELENTFINDVM